jgi:hypothetical protein
MKRASAKVIPMGEAQRLRGLALCDRRLAAKAALDKAQAAYDTINVELMALVERNGRDGKLDLDEFKVFIVKQKHTTFDQAEYQRVLVAGGVRPVLIEKARKAATVTKDKQPFIQVRARKD